MGCAFGDLAKAKGALLGLGGVRGSVTDLRLGKKLLRLASNALFHFWRYKGQLATTGEILIGPHGNPPGPGTASPPEMVS